MYILLYIYYWIKICVTNYSANQSTAHIMVKSIDMRTLIITKYLNMLSRTKSKPSIIKVNKVVVKRNKQLTKITY